MPLNADIDERLRPHHLQVAADVRLVHVQLAGDLGDGGFATRRQQLPHLVSGRFHTPIVSRSAPNNKT